MFRCLNRTDSRKDNPTYQNHSSEVTSEKRYTTRPINRNKLISEGYVLLKDGTYFKEDNLGGYHGITPGAAREILNGS